MISMDRLKIWLFVSFRALLIGAGIFALIRSDWTNLILSFVTLFLTFIPALIERKMKVDYPSEFEISILIFLLASLYLGEMRSFYIRIWWWDILMHTLFSIIIAQIGFSLVYIWNKEERVSLKLSPLFIALFAFSFAVSAGAIWEVFEFSMDTSLGTNLQKSGLVDTIGDLVVDILAAGFVSVIGYLYLKGRNKPKRRFEKFVKRFIRKNPHLF